jgi:hypothetical protein
MTDRYAAHTAQLAEKLGEARDAGEIRNLSDLEIEREVRGYIALMDGLELQWLLDPDFDLLGAWKYHYENAQTLDRPHLGCGSGRARAEHLMERGAPPQSCGLAEPYPEGGA